MSSNFQNFYFVEEDLNEARLGGLWSQPGLNAVANLFRTQKKIPIKQFLRSLTVVQISPKGYQQELQKWSNAYINKTKYGKKKNIFVNDLKEGILDTSTLYTMNEQLKRIGVTSEIEDDIKILNSKDINIGAHLPVYSLNNGGKVILMDLPIKGDSSNRILCFGIDAKAAKILREMTGMMFKDYLRTVVAGGDTGSWITDQKPGQTTQTSSQTQQPSKQGLQYKTLEISKEDFKRLAPAGFAIESVKPFVSFTDELLNSLNETKKKNKELPTAAELAMKKTEKKVKTTRKPKEAKLPTAAELAMKNSKPEKTTKKASSKPVEQKVAPKKEEPKVEPVQEKPIEKTVEPKTEPVNQNVGTGELAQTLHNDLAQPEPVKITKTNTTSNILNGWHYLIKGENTNESESGVYLYKTKDNKYMIGYYQGTKAEKLLKQSGLVGAGANIPA